MSLIYFVRHGESIGNQLLIDNLSDDENILSDNGRLQANNLGIHLQNVTFTHVFSSPYIRAISTAQHILSASKTVYSDDAIVVDPDIRERNMGIYEQKPVTELVKALMKAGDDYIDWTPEGAESKLDVELRLEPFLQKIGIIVDSGLERKTILVVTHCALMVHLWHYLLRCDQKYRFKNWKPEFMKVSKNASYFLLTMDKLQDDVQPRDLEVVVAHGSDHLKSLEQDAFSSCAHRDETLDSGKSCMQQ
ncbi:unnamed protein product [Allacma fusca]|uniref:Phosphoglycerate mutase n=1 Tax=Allacma fusca TaxID=39272 RepID=A0A8J2LDY3_9HEXA|nr:unnamed protein product [Allacma fusca]